MIQPQHAHAKLPHGPCQCALSTLFTGSPCKKKNKSETAATFAGKSKPGANSVHRDAPAETGAASSAAQSGASPFLGMCYTKDDLSTAIGCWSKDDVQSRTEAEARLTLTAIISFRTGARVVRHCWRLRGFRLFGLLGVWVGIPSPLQINLAKAPSRVQQKMHVAMTMRLRCYLSSHREIYGEKSEVSKRRLNGQLQKSQSPKPQSPNP